MRSTFLLFSCIVLCLGTFATAQIPTSVSSQDVDLNQISACLDPCAVQLTQQVDAACGAGATANATEEQSRCICTTQSIEGAIKTCVQQTCNATVATASISLFETACQAGLNGTVTAGGNSTATPTPSAGSGGSDGHNSAFVLLAGSWTTLGLAFIAAVVTLY